MRQGRVSLVDLAALLNVDLFYCEKGSQAILASADTSEALAGMQVSWRRHFRSPGRGHSLGTLPWQGCLSPDQAS